MNAALFCLHASEMPGSPTPLKHNVQVGEAYVIFSVRGSLEKQKSPTVAGSKGAFSWAESTFELQIPDPTNASLEVTLRVTCPD